MIFALQRAPLFLVLQRAHSKNAFPQGRRVHKCVSARDNSRPLQRGAAQKRLSAGQFFELDPHKLDLIYSKKRRVLELFLKFQKRFIGTPIYCSESADRERVRPTNSALNSRGGKTNGCFPLAAPLFPSPPLRRAVFARFYF